MAETVNELCDSCNPAAAMKSKYVRAFIEKLIAREGGVFFFCVMQLSLIVVTRPSLILDPILFF